MYDIFIHRFKRLYLMLLLTDELFKNFMIECKHCERLVNSRPHNLAKDVDIVGHMFDTKNGDFVESFSQKIGKLQIPHLL